MQHPRLVLKSDAMCGELIVEVCGDMHRQTPGPDRGEPGAGG